VKRILLLVSLFIIAGVLLGHLFLNKSSYVLFVYDKQAFETSLWFFSILLLIAYFISTYLFRALTIIFHPKKRFNDWAFDRRVAASKRDFFQGVLDFEAGAWDKALKKFKAAANNLDRPIVAYLYAARTAQHLNRKDIREEMLHEAAQVEPKSSLAIGLVRAELLMEEKSFGEAKEVLEGLKRASPNQHRVLELLLAIDTENK
jgi:HemY protein